MTFCGYWRLVLERAFTGSWGLPERIELALGIVAGALQVFLPPVSYPLIGRLLAFLWAVPAVLLVWTFIKRLAGAPYEIHLETLARIPDPRKAEIRERLGALLREGREAIYNVNRDGLPVVSDSIITWLWNVSSFLGAELSPSAIAQFRHATELDPARPSYLSEHRVIRGLEAGCTYLSGLIDRYS
jgi:hypothetical protein